MGGSKIGDNALTRLAERIGREATDEVPYHLTLLSHLSLRSSLLA